MWAVPLDFHSVPTWVRPSWSKGGESPLFRARVLLVEVQALCVPAGWGSHVGDTQLWETASFSMLKWQDTWQPRLPRCPVEPCTPASLFPISTHPTGECSFLLHPDLAADASEKLELTLLRGACSGWTRSCTADAGRHRGCSPLVFQQAGCDDFKYFLRALSHPSPNDTLRCSGPCMHHFLKEFIFQLTTGNISSLFTLREAKAKIECFTYMVTSWQNSYIWFSWGCLHHFEVALGSLLVRTFPAQRIVIKIYCAAVASFSYRIIMVRRMVSDGKFSEAWLLWPKRENVLERESDGRNRGRKKAKLCFKKLFYIHSSLEREETSNVFVKQNQG